jgi:hypothetical protein
MRSSQRCGPHYKAPEHRGGSSIRMSNSRYAFAFSQRAAPEVCVWSSLKNEGAGNAGCALHPRSRVQICAKKDAHEHTGSAEALRHSLRNGFTAYNALSPENRALLSPSSQGIWHAGPVGLSAPPQDLTPTTEASGPHDFTVRISIVRPARRCPLTENRPANTLHARHRRVHRIPSQRSVTMANAPSSGTGWRES